MNTLVVGVGGLRTSNSATDVIRTYGLGTCVAVIVLAPSRRAGGLLHVALPDSRINPQLALEEPGRFADTGIPVLLRKMAMYGCGSRDLVIKLAGGASVLDGQDYFQIGKRNILAVKKVLWKYKLGALTEDLGGSITRTVTVTVGDGKVILSTPGREDKLL